MLQFITIIRNPTMITEKETIRDINFLDWLYQRLKFKYREDESILEQINCISKEYKLLPKKIPVDLINKICKKHYPDFDIEKTPDLNIGYTNTERLQIQNLVLDIISDTTNFAKDMMDETTTT